ncbi:hypothetical protein [Streptomyces sp. NPDC001315]|uniref:hypothetical protein n=1 Tax=Streptomyces sp. NPDC001315 TaxID=3364562 RepID=UPI00368E48E2
MTNNSPDDLGPDDRWPLLPAWMWDCRECVRKYEAMKYLQAEIAGLVADDPGVDRDFMDSIVGTQISLSRHLADAHPEMLPGWDPDCRTCAGHRGRLAQTEESSEFRLGTVMVADEHRARHLFAPPRTVGLM